MKLGSSFEAIIMFAMATLRVSGFTVFQTARVASAQVGMLHASDGSALTKSYQQSIFLDQVEESVSRVLKKYDSSGDAISSIDDLPPQERESLGVARNLNTRLQAFARNNDCRRCWLQQSHCVCEECPPLEESTSSPALPKVNRLFLLTHHKEICLVVDTAKLILAAFPETCRLVVGGISSEFQDSMKELEESIQQNNCLVLFPTDDARTFEQVEASETLSGEKGWDLVVVDGTWSQARKIHSRYLQDTSGHVQLSDAAVATLAQSALEETREGHQMRRHPIKWKEVSTLEATRLFLGDMMTSSKERPWDTLAPYQQRGDAAAIMQLGPHRMSPKATGAAQ
jgi:DTW domain-containing protein YfiP